MSHPLVPDFPPFVVQDFYTERQVDALDTVVRTNGPWPLLASIAFSSTKEFLAVAGGKNPRPDARLTDYTAPTFRGYIGKQAICYHDELRDVYFDPKSLDLIKEVHNAKYSMPHSMQFNIGGPSHSYDAGHFDGPNWRGINTVNTRPWLIAVMAKSGLFDAWKVETAQIITYFFDSDQGGGFTYWPDGPDAQPKRIAPPFRGTTIVSDNSKMYHRREANGPAELRDCPDLEIHTTLHWEGDDQWVLRNHDREIGRFTDTDRRTLFHWTGLVFQDMAEVRAFTEHSDDLTTSKVFELLIGDLHRRGVKFTEPTDPAHDPQFIELLSRTYDMHPQEYPPEAPLDCKFDTYVA